MSSAIDGPEWRIPIPSGLKPLSDEEAKRLELTDEQKARLRERFDDLDRHSCWYGK